MILTKDNVLRYIREKKYVTPTTISEQFETSTMIASAALSELAKAKQVIITHIKIGSTPYYLDPLQKSALDELGEKHLSGTDKEVFNMLKEAQVINDNSLSIQHRLAVERIKDFALPLEVDFEDKVLKFWVWYLRDLKETRKQILEVLNPKNTPSKKTSSNTQAQREIKHTIQEEVKQIIPQRQKTPNYPNQVNIPNQNKPTLNSQQRFENKSQSHDEEESKTENLIEIYFKQNYLKIDSKNKTDNTIKYKTSLHINELIINFDCIYFAKKTNDSQVLKFYTSSQKPKIVFIENAPKKLLKLGQNLENFEIINL